ncbi:MAG: protein translocase subunit SecF [Pseudomonadota bacterium]|mgnify:FL=1|jgi:preprotein translocase SecF subunit|nr:protein translocase subunit SecF [Pseudomonadota bacterium]MED5253659.1 protein translocase subunit SecF [Pseudomonadota bacterium]MED5484390.1 protein translocase subunit SecF [Pseudomonadota bacterium]|tara:strand:- start:1227 stop:2135 length:909 start_codon:yes stop_codon:yes gene_type:complete
MTSIRWIKRGLKIDFLKIKNIATILSVIAIISSLFFLVYKNLNFGIDFKGGTLIELKKDNDLTIAEIRSQLSGLNIGDIQIQTFGSDNIILIRIENSSNLVANADMNTIELIRSNLGDDITIQRTEIVGPKVSSELIQKGIIAIVIAVFLMLFYIWIRFEWQFSIGAVTALIHDVIITMGIFSLLQIEFNLSIIAALLTIIGYSMNDTVVVYDRIRENLRKYKQMNIYELINQSLNETMSRTLLTSVTTLLALFSLYFLGGEVLRGFTLAMIIGVFIGTYSSIFIASQMILYLNVKRDWSKN